VKISRRHFLAGVGAAGAAIGVDAFGYEAHRVLLSRHQVLVEGLPSSLNGLRIAQVTDVHFPGIGAAARAALEHLDRERPDIVILTGDMTESAGAMTEVRDFAAESRGSIATIAIQGNWEYFAGVQGDASRAAYRQAGVQFLVNDATTVDVGGASLTFVGLDDAVVGRPDIAAARRSVAPGSTEIWLVHAPIFAEKPPIGVAARPVMMLSGHTHGGQIRLPLLPPVKPVGAGRFLEGWYRDTFAPLYVSRGVGTTGIPARFRCPAELPIFTLRAA
jgi:predicted MPP superfamily phosphohydrolase